MVTPSEALGFPEDSPEALVESTLRICSGSKWAEEEEGRQGEGRGPSRSLSGEEDLGRACALNSDSC